MRSFSNKIYDKNRKNKKELDALSKAKKLQNISKYYMKLFREWMESKKDEETIKRVSSICENILKQLEVYYLNLFGIYFPSPKQTDNHEKFMTWRNSCRSYENNPPKYLDRWVSIQSGQTNPTLGGQYFDNKIHLYDKEFSQLYQELRQHHQSFEYNLRGTPTPRLRRENIEVKKEARLIHEKMMQRFEIKKQDYLSTLFHELTHLFDHDKLGNNFDKVYQNSTNKLNKEINKSGQQKTKSQIYNDIYMNNDMETNAWFLTQARKTLTKQFPNFQALLKDFQYSFGNHWSLLSQDKQRKMISRLYQIYASSSVGV